MATVLHSSLTGSELHEPKGIASAIQHTVYIADGGGSGDWSYGPPIAITPPPGYNGSRNASQVCGIVLNGNVVSSASASDTYDTYFPFGGILVGVEIRANAGVATGVTNSVSRIYKNGTGGTQLLSYDGGSVTTYSLRLDPSDTAYWLGNESQCTLAPGDYLTLYYAGTVSTGTGNQLHGGINCTYWVVPFANSDPFANFRS